MAFLYVFVGGGLGALCRYGIAQICASTTKSFPWATFYANVLSCILLGLLLAWLTSRTGANKNLYLLLVTGYCGGFSTFSTFTADTFRLLQNDQWLLASGYILASIIICLLSLVLGYKIYTVLFG